MENTKKELGKQNRFLRAVKQLKRLDAARMAAKMTSEERLRLMGRLVAAEITEGSSPRLRLASSILGEVHALERA